MKIYHTSPSPISGIHGHGTLGECLCFSSSVYVMSRSSTVYVYSIDTDAVSICDAHDLFDSEIVADISSRFGCDDDLAERLLDGRENEWNQSFEVDADDSFWMQEQRAMCAKKMGYDGVRDVDEQGAVYIIPMQGREHLLTLERAEAA